MMLKWLRSSRMVRNFVSRQNIQLRQTREKRVPQFAPAIEKLEPRELMSATQTNVGLGGYYGGSSNQTPNYPNSPISGMDDSQFLPPQVIQSVGTSTSVGTNTLTDTNQNWAVNSLQGSQVVVTVGSNLVTAVIQSNTANTITLTGNWVSTPGSTTPYQVFKLADPTLYVSDDFNQVTQTNDWWSSLLWRFQGDTGTNPIYPHPFVTQFRNSGITQGLAVAYPSKLTTTWIENNGQYNIRETDYDYFMAGNGFDLANFGVNIQNVPLTDLKNVKVESYSDWGVTVSFGNSADRLYATMLQGSPYIYFTTDTTVNNEVEFSLNNQTYTGHTSIDFHDYGDGTAYFGVPTGDHMVYYGLFGMSGVDWSINNVSASNPKLTSSGLNNDYFAMVMLPPGFDPSDPGADAMFDTFKAHAYAEVKVSSADNLMGTYVSYSYSTSTNQVVTTFGADVLVHSRTFADGTQLVNTPLMALYPHQWKASPNATFLGDDYNYGEANNFAKGLMKLYALNANVTNPWNGNTASTSFTTTLQHQGGLLPFLPPVTTGTMDSNPTPGIIPTFNNGNFPDPNSLVQLVEYTAFTSPPILNPQLDGYGTGKVLLKLANLVAIADQLSTSPNVHPLDRPLMALARDKLLNSIKLELARFMGATRFENYTQLFQFLYYNQPTGSDYGWDTLIPYNAGYGAGQLLNDHHFHFGYFLHAAGILAMYDPEFLAEANGNDNFAGLLEMMAQDVANWDRQAPSDSGVVFPFLRNFAPYIGHSYASGPGTFASGNNQESSSEAMNFWMGLSLLGEAFMNAGLGNGQKMRDLGIALYETEASNIEQYTFNIDGDIFPTTFTNQSLTPPAGGMPLTMSAQNWDSGSHNGLFFATNFAEAPFSINWLPISAGSLYLGRHSGAKGTNSYVEKNWDFYWKNIQEFGLNDPTYSSDFPYPVYPGTDFAYQALYDPAGALTNYNTYFNASNIQGRGNLGFDPGESAALTLNWIKTLSQYGYLDASVTATGTSMYAAFRKTAGGDATYVAYNPSLQAITVTFTDGANTIVLNVAAKSMAYQTGVSGSTSTQATGAVAFGTSSGSNTSTTLNDTTQNWLTGQFDGLLLTITGGTGAGQQRVINSTAANSLTVTQAWTTNPDNTSIYTITQSGPSILQQPQQVVYANVTSSGSTSNTMVDSSATWTTNQFAGMLVYLTGGPANSGYGQVGLITSNTATTLTISTTWATTPTSGVLYQIQQPAKLGPQMYLTTNGAMTATQPENRSTPDTAVTIPAIVAAGFGSVPATGNANTAQFILGNVNLTITDPSAVTSAATSQFAVWLKDHNYAASGASQIIGLAIRYKWSGGPKSDNDWDRIEMFQTTGSQQNYIGSNAPDTNVPATFDLWNLYDSVRNPVVNTGYIQGNNPTWSTFKNGTIEVSIWMTAGARETDVSINSPEALGRQSFIALPNFYGSGLGFGSAPESYKTSLLEDGPRHPAVNAHFAGSVDTTTDALVGTASVDGSGNSVVVAPLVVGQDSYLLANVQHAITTTYLDAWIDFDADGVFETNERITDPSGTVVTNGINRLDFSVLNSAVVGKSYARFRLSSVGGLDPTGLAPDGDIIDQAVWIDSAKPAFARQKGIEGFYFFGSETTQVLKGNNNQLTIVRSDGSALSAILSNDGKSFSGTGVSGTFDAEAGLLTLNTSEIWRKVQQVAGHWLTPSGRGGATQLGTDLRLTNAFGTTVDAQFINALQVAVPVWGGIVGTLSGHGTQIHWANSTNWSLIPELGNAFANQQGAPVRIEQNGADLVLVNRVGGTSRGVVIGPNQVKATDWGNLLGTLTENSIQWANGTTWNQDLPGSSPDIGGLWDVFGQSTRILQAGDQLTFVNRFGGTSAGHFISSTEVIADDWGGIRGVLSGTQLVWIGNGMVWSQLPELGGTYIDQLGRQTGISQLERSLTFTGPQGQVSHGTLVGLNQINETDGARRQGIVSGNVVVWPSAGQTWTELPNLRGNWSVATAGGAPAYAEQSGRSLLVVSQTGVIGRGQFLNPVAASLRYEGSPADVIASVAGPNTLAFSNGALWSHVAEDDLDTVFADPEMWPFA